MREPTARSVAEERLERIHSDDDAPVTREDAHDNRIELEREYARLLANHPHFGMTPWEILEAADYDLAELQATAAEFFPEHFDGGAADV